MTAIDDPGATPKVSIVVPMLDERDHIVACLDGFAGQRYPLDRLEVLVIDGGSRDGSRQIVERMAEVHDWIRVIENPARKASAAFNLGVEAAKGDVVCLFSAHGVPHEDFVRRSVDALMGDDVAGVGGQYHHVGTDPVSNAIGLAMVSPFGMASPHRFATQRKDVDTISHPAYRRRALVDIGPFDETLQRNSDYELNWRLRAAGERLLFDPSIESVYRPRSSLRALGRQFWWYGRWKVRVLERHPASLRARHLVAPAATLAAVLAPLGLMGRRTRPFVVAGAAAYAAVVAVAVRRARPRSHDASPVVLAACFPVMHGCWGAGFLVSAAQDARQGGRRD